MVSMTPHSFTWVFTSQNRMPISAYIDAAAKRDLTVRRYVLEALEERLREDLGDDGDSVLTLTAQTDPVLAALWDNRRDAAYDRL